MRFLKWAGIVLGALIVVGFLAFLYNIPPFFLQSPEQFGAEVKAAAASVDHITDPAQRAIAEHGRMIVTNTGCIGCHAVNGSQGPDYSRYLGGGGVKITSKHGSYVSRNLTSDAETGLARRTDEELKRVLRSGTFADGHVAPYSAMPWANFSNWTEEDRHAVLVYLRSLKPVRQRIPEPLLEPADMPPGVVERDFGGKDYGIN